MVEPAPGVERGHATAASILIVDDHEANLLALEAVLEPLGHPLTRASSGEEALRCVLDRDFAVILLDVMMPGLDGFQTAELIRDRERSRGTPIIFLSALSNTATDIAQGYAHGAVDYLTKPFDPYILRSKVDVFVELYRTREAIRQQATVLHERERERDELQHTLTQARHHREKAEAAAAAYRFVAESIPQQVWTATPEGTLDYVNSVVQRYFAQPPEAILRAGWLAAMHEADRATSEQRWKTSVETGVDYDVEFRLRRHDGMFRWHLARAVPERSVDGGSSGGSAPTRTSRTARRPRRSSYVASISPRSRRAGSRTPRSASTSGSRWRRRCPSATRCSTAPRPSSGTSMWRSRGSGRSTTTHRCSSCARVPGCTPTSTVRTAASRSASSRSA
ncbi:MAG: response regulator [Deltaproteobacteria bacterium]|nr:response regulator [Deltaproteobacteria bacterium]